MSDVNIENQTHSISFDDFTKVDMRIGTVVDVQINKKARIPAYVLTIDFGEIGIKTSSAQITEHYSMNDLKNRQVVAVVNFLPKRIAGIKSEVLVLGVYEPDGVVILGPSKPVKNGLKIA